MNTSWGTIIRALREVCVWAVWKNLTFVTLLFSLTVWSEASKVVYAWHIKNRAYSRGLQKSKTIAYRGLASRWDILRRLYCHCWWLLSLCLVLMQSGSGQHDMGDEDSGNEEIDAWPLYHIMGPSSQHRVPGDLSWESWVTKWGLGSRISIGLWVMCFLYLIVIYGS